MSEIENLIVNPVADATLTSENPVVDSTLETNGKKKSKKKVLVLDAVNELNIGALSLNSNVVSDETDLTTSVVPATPKKSRSKKSASVATDIADGVVATDNGIADGVVANSEPSLESKTLSELKEQCKLLEIKGYSKKNKGDLIALIRSKAV
jgi:hypothetical protein